MRLLNVDRALVLAVLRVTERDAAKRNWSRLGRDPKFAFQEMANLLFMGGVTLAALFPWPWFWVLQRPGSGLLLASAKYWIVLWPICITTAGALELRMRASREKDLLADAMPERVDIFGNSKVIWLGSAMGTVATVVIGLALGATWPF